jgi:hypothetical protein
VDPGTSPTNYPQLAQQAYGYVAQLGPATGNSDFHYTKRLTPRHVIGDRMALTADRFVGSSGTNPVDQTYFGWSVVDPIGSFANGVLTQMIITYKVEFFDRKNLVEFFAWERQRKKELYEESKKKIQTKTSSPPY